MDSQSWVCILFFAGTFTGSWAAEACSKAQIDLAFALDASGSIGESDFNLMKTFVKNFVQGADIDGLNARVGVITYESTATVNFYLNSYNRKSDVLNAITSIPYTAGGTDTVEALQSLRNEMFTVGHGDRPQVKNVAILMTDGESGGNLKVEADLTKALGITIYGIGIGNANTQELDDIASKPLQQTRFNASSFSQLAPLRDRLFKSVCRVVIPPSTTPKPIDLNNICIINNWADGIHPNPLNCHGFVECSGGITYLMHCPLDLVWDSSIQTCQYPRLAVCHSDPPTLPPKVIYERKMCEQKHLKDGIHPDPFDCNKFIECVSYLTYIYDCPGNLKFDK